MPPPLSLGDQQTRQKQSTRGVGTQEPGDKYQNKTAHITTDNNDIPFSPTADATDIRPFA